jgi:hypothetical protein
MNDHQSVTVYTAPSVEPLTLEEAQSHLRVTNDQEDRLIMSLIGAARRQIETDTRRAIITQTLKLTLDRFPSSCERRHTGNYDGGVPYFGRYQTIFVPRPPLQTVSSISYVDGNGATQTMSASDYLVDTRSEPGRITPAYATSWPAARHQLNSVTITYIAGWTPATVPETVKQLMRLWVSHFFENREAVTVGTIATEMPLAVQALTSALEWGDYA